MSAPNLPSAEAFFTMTHRVLNTIIDDFTKGDGVEHLCILAGTLATCTSAVVQQELLVKASNDARDFMERGPRMAAQGGNLN